MLAELAAVHKKPAREPAGSAPPERGALGAYDGELNEAGQRHGKGTMRFPSGESYEGEWQEGKAHGSGKFRYKSGAEYEGEWNSNVKEGWGTLRLPSGRVAYKGEWLSDQRCGRGKFAYPDGSMYDGQWAANMRSGHGTFSFANRAAYDGGYSGGRKDGPGTYTFPNGFAQVSVHEAGRPTGKGARWSVDREQAWRLKDGKVEGTFAEPVLGEITFPLGIAEQLAAKVGLEAPPRRGVEAPAVPSRTEALV